MLMNDCRVAGYAVLMPMLALAAFATDFALRVRASAIDMLMPCRCCCYRGHCRRYAAALLIRCRCCLMPDFSL